MARNPKYKRKMVYDPVTNMWRSQTSNRVLTPEQYAARVENAKKAAAASKALGEYMRTDEYKQEVDAMVNCPAGPMRRLPGQSDFDYQLSHVRWTRRGPADLKITRGGGGNGNDG